MKVRVRVYYMYFTLSLQRQQCITNLMSSGLKSLADGRPLLLFCPPYQSYGAPPLAGVFDTRDHLEDHLVTR